MGTKRYTDKDVSVAVTKSFSYRNVLKLLGLRPTGGNYDCIKRKISKLGLDTSHFTLKGWSKGKIFGPKRDLEYYLSGNPGAITSHALRLRLLKEGIKEAKCEVCGLTRWQNEPIPLELEHVDGDHFNNRLENLKILCPNCHALTPTYRAKNRKDYKLGAERLELSLRRESGLKPDVSAVPPRPHVIYSTCLLCNAPIYKKGRKHCSYACSSLAARRVVRPSKEELLKEIAESNFLQIGKKYGVSDNAIRKWLK